MSYLVTLSKRVANRYMCDISLGDEMCPAIIDTACSTTLMPLIIANKHGRPTSHKQKVTVGGRTYDATLYRVDNVVIGNFVIERLSVFAAKYEGNLKERVLIGQNILNNINFSISKNASRMKFEIDIWSIAKSKKYPFTLFFNQHGSNPVYDPDLMQESVGDCESPTAALKTERNQPSP